MTTARPAHSSTAHAHLFTIALAWSAHPRVVRIDPERTHHYPTSHRTPPSPNLSLPPTMPWAIHTTDAQQHRTILVADFDHSSTTTPTDDAARLCAVLAGLGCPYLLTRSSVDNAVDSGRRHVLVLLDTVWDDHRSAAVTTWLRQHFPTLDPTPMASSRTAAIRFPGAPHRSGGHAELAAIGLPEHADPVHVLTGQLRAPTDLHARLLACTPHAATPVPAGLLTPHTARIIDTAEQLAAIAATAATTLAAAMTGLQPANRTPHNDLPPAPTAPTPSATGTATVPALPARPWAAPIDPTNLLPPLDDFDLTAPAPAPTTPATPTRSCTTVRHRSTHNIDRRLATMNPELARLLYRHGDLPTDVDASQIQHRVLMSMAARRLTFDDVYTLADHYGGQAFTHSRSIRLHTRRVRRPHHDFRAHLARQYERATTEVAKTGYGRRAATHAIDTVVTQVAALLATAETDPELGYTRTGHTCMRILTAHLKRALDAATGTYYAGCRDLASDAGIASPQTAAAATHHLVTRGYLNIVTPADGPHATVYTLGTNTDWTQGEPAPRRDSLWHLLASRSLHFQHDVWLSPTLPAAASVVMFHLCHHNARTITELAERTGYTPATVMRSMTRLREVNLVDDTLTPHATTSTYVAAAHSIGCAGHWSRLRHRWHLEQLRWTWWCAEQDFLRARTNERASAWNHSMLAERGRYPRTPGGDPDHTRALHVYADLIPLSEVAQ